MKKQSMGLNEGKKIPIVGTVSNSFPRTMATSFDLSKKLVKTIS